MSGAAILKAVFVLIAVVGLVMLIRASWSARRSAK